MNNKSVTKNISIIFIGSITSLLIGLITAPVITRLVNPDEYGQLSFFVMYTNIFALGLSLGLERAFSRYYYDTEEELRNNLFVTCIKKSIISFLIMSPLIFIFGNYLNISLNETYVLVMAVFLINLFTNLLERYFVNLLRVKQQAYSYATTTIINKIVYPIAVVALYYLTDIDNYLILIISMMISSILATGIALLLILNSNPKMFCITKIQPISAKKLFKYSIPIMVQGMVAILFQSTDKLIINYYLTFNEVGIYASALYFVNVVTIFSTSIITIIGPEMYKNHAENPDNIQYYVKVNRFLTFMLFIMVVTMIYTKDFLIYILGESYRDASYVMPLLLLTPILSSVSGVNSISIEIKEKTKYFLLITLVSAIVNIACNFFLIPIMGIRGAAISTGFSYIIYYILTTIIAKKLYPFDFGFLKFMFVSILIWLFALYNSYYKIDILSSIAYIFIIILVLILYKQQFLESIKYVAKIIKRRICKNEKN